MTNKNGTCFHCGSDSLIWLGDHEFGECGLDGEGVVHMIMCQECGADIEYYVEGGEKEEKRMGNERECNKCLWATRDGNCASWDCEFVPKREAYEAWKRTKEEEKSCSK